MTTRPMGRMGWLAAAVLAMTFATAHAAAPAKNAIPTDRLLPPGVQVYVTIPDAQELAKRWESSLIGRLWQDKDMAPFRKEVEKAVEEHSKELSEKLGVTWADLAKVPSGEVSFAIVQIPGKKPSMVAFLAYGDQKTVDKLLDAAEAALEKNEAKKKETEVEETKVIQYTVTPKKDEDDEDAPKKDPQTVAYFVKDSCLVVGSDLPVLENVLARWDGKHEKTFADNEVHRYITDRCKNDKADAALSWYVNPVGLFQGVAQSSGDIQTALAVSFLQPLGLTNFKAMGGSFDLATSEFDSVSRTLLYVEQPTGGVLNAFQFPPAAQTPPKWIPADASNWYAMNWDVTGAYNAVEETVDQFRGKGTFSKLVDQIAANEQGPKLHIKKDFIDLLNGKIEVFSTPAEKSDDEPAPERFLMGLGTKDKAKMEGVLAKVSKTPGFPGKTREFQGTTLYDIPTGGVGKGLGMGVVNGYLMITSDVTLLEQVLRGDKDRESLVDSAAYKQVATKFPARTSIAGFQKQDAQMKTVYDLFKSGQGAAVTNEIDFSTLPDFDVIKKYLTPTGSYAEPDKNGVLFVSFSLKASSR